MPMSPIFVYCKLLLISEVALIKPLKPATMASLILCHLMHCVMNSVKILSLCIACDTHLILVGTSLCVHTLLKVGLGIPYHLSEELCKLSSVLCLLPSITLESVGHLRITLTISLTRHSQVHTYLCALAHEVSVEVFLHLIINVFCYADLVLCHEFEKFFLIKLFEF